MITRLFATSLLSLLLGSSALCVNVDATFNDVTVLIKAGNVQQAIRACESLLQSDPSPAVQSKATYRLAHAYYKGKQPQKAIDLFLKVAEKYPNSPEAPGALLRVGYLRDSIKAQPVEWETLVQRYPESSEAAVALVKLGFIALRMGDPDLAVKRFSEASESKHAQPQIKEEALVEAGYAHISRYWKSANPAVLGDAIKHFADLKNKKLSSTAAVRVRLALGETNLILGYCKEAAQDYQEVLDLNPRDSYMRGVAQFELGCVYFAANDYEKAISAYDTFLSSCTGGTLQEKDKFWRDARPGYAQLVVKEPDKARTLTGLELIPQAAYYKADSLRRLGRYGDAEALANEIVLSFPNLSIKSKVVGLAKWCASVDGRAK